MEAMIFHKYSTLVLWINGS